MTGTKINEEKVQEEGNGNKKQEENGEVEKKEIRECEWMIRPCDTYEEEYSDCTSLKARFHQYFIFGENLDCSQWKKDHKNCIEWKKYHSEDAFDELIASEKHRRSQRLRAHYANDIWKKRDKPPEDWNKPLPEWMQKEHEGTYLYLRSKELKENKSPSEERSSCRIS